MPHTVKYEIDCPRCGKHDTHKKKYESVPQAIAGIEEMKPRFGPSAVVIALAWNRLNVTRVCTPCVKLEVNHENS